MTLPATPFDGQVFVDFHGVQWRFDTERNCWMREGKITTIPVASSGETGLLSSRLKGFIDTVHNKGGGFGIIVDPKLSVRSEDNPDGVLFGDVSLTSNSLGISCVFADGKLIPDDCKFVPYAPEVDEFPPGFDINFKEQFLSTMCAEIPGGPGPKGDDGEKGIDGRPGTGDGPIGETGNIGEDAIAPATFTGIQINDVDDIFDTAVVNLELDAPNGRLHITKSKVKVPDNETPADQVITSPISRSLEFSTGFDFTILSSAQDTIDNDPNIGIYPASVSKDSALENSPVNVTRLSEFITLITNFYQSRLDQTAIDYDAQLEEFFKGLDNDARQKLDIISEELANCEFQLPIEFCLGITPEDCSAESGPNSESTEALCALAGFLLNDATFCEDSVGTDLGTIKLEPDEEKSVTFSIPGQPNSTTLPLGAYFIIYTSGTLFDSGEPGRGHFVGTGAADTGIKVDVFEPGDVVGTTVEFPVTGEAFNEFDPSSVEQAYQNGPFEERVVSIKFATDGGSIVLRSPTPTDQGSGSISLRILKCDECP